MKKLVSIIIIIVIATVVGGGAFYGGMKYQENKTSKRFTVRNGASGANTLGGIQGRKIGNSSGSNFLNGEVVSKDDKSVTIKLQDARLPDGQGGSKIIFFSDATKITKSALGSVNDLEIGKNIFVNGKQNQDGSFTAETIQLNPQASSNQ